MTHAPLPLRRMVLPALGAVLALSWLSAPPARAGHIEDRDGKTIIHVTVFGLPDPSNTDTFNRGEVAGVRAFKERFPAMFAAALPRKNTSKTRRSTASTTGTTCEVELQQFSGIQVEGVESDLLAIAGGMAPDVLYVNFRRSDNYIQNGFLYPLDKPEDGYLTSMTPGGDRLPRPRRSSGRSSAARARTGEKHVWAMPYGGALGKVLLLPQGPLRRERRSRTPRSNWTWDDMIAAARKISRPGEQHRTGCCWAAASTRAGTGSPSCGRPAAR